MLPKIFLICGLVFWTNVSIQETMNIFTNSLTDYHVISNTMVLSDLNRIETFMMDSSAYTDWLHFCKEANLIKEINSSKWLFEFIYDSDSRLLRDRYLMAEISFWKNSTNDSLHFHINKPQEFAEIDQIPRKVVEVSDFNITWLFVQMSDSVKIQYDLFLDPSLPGIIKNKKKANTKVNTYLIELSRHSINNLTKHVED